MESTSGDPGTSSEWMMTIDVEEYFHLLHRGRMPAVSDWDNLPSRVCSDTYRILELLEATGNRATFFVLGWVALKHPQLLRAIATAGHEIACHGHLHRQITLQSRHDFRKDLRDARRAIIEAAGVQPVAYRAPVFSITARTKWALEILVEEGFRYDSSIFPVHHDRYGIPDSPRGIHSIETPSGPIWEVPLTVARVAGLNIPIAGGGYMRLYPRWFMRWGLRRHLLQTGSPPVVYFHPWEFDLHQPSTATMPLTSRFRHRIGIRNLEAKVGDLLKRHRFTTISDSVAVLRDRQPVPSDNRHTEALAV